MSDQLSLFPSLRQAVALKDVYIVGTDDWILETLLDLADAAWEVGNDLGGGPLERDPSCYRRFYDAIAVLKGA